MLLVIDDGLLMTKNMVSKNPSLGDLRRGIRGRFLHQTACHTHCRADGSQYRNQRLNDVFYYFASARKYGGELLFHLFAIQS